jgi:anti-anti-sigma factor
MKLDYHEKNSALVVDIPDSNGSLIDDEDIIPYIEDIYAVYDQGTYSSIALNMSKKTYLNSSGLSNLVQIKDYLVDKNIAMSIIDLKPKVESLLSMVGMLEFFTVHRSEDSLE